MVVYDLPKVEMWVRPPARRAVAVLATDSLELIYYEAYREKSDAVARELYLKTGDGRQEIRKQLRYTLQ